MIIPPYFPWGQDYCDLGMRPHSSSRTSFVLPFFCLLPLGHFPSDPTQESHRHRTFPLNQPPSLFSHLLISCVQTFPYFPLILQQTLVGSCPSYAHEVRSRFKTSLGSQLSWFQKRKQKSPIQPVT